MPSSTYTFGYPQLTPAVKWLLIVNVGAFVLQMFPGIGPLIALWGALEPRMVFTHGQAWRLITYMFLHENFMHLAFNMLALWMFSLELEQKWGTRRFLTFYFVGGIGSGLFSFLMWNSAIVGASGAIFALLVAYGHFFPDRQVLLFFFFPIPARIAAIVLFVLLLLLTVPANIAHLTHLGGIVVAYVYLWVGPRFEAYVQRREALQAEQDRRARAESYLARARYFAEVIDPILKKISEQGTGSLTRKEKALLKKAATTDRERLKRGRILPFDLFA